MDFPKRNALRHAAALAGAATLAALFGVRTRPIRAATPDAYPFALSDIEWQKRLGSAAFDVLRKEGTERPYSSPLNGEHRTGTFACAGCDQPAFSSQTKFDSGTGWPSFWAPLDGAVGERSDRSLVMARTEVHCTRCGGHLGHVFDDGPKPTGLRYCMNGVALHFRPSAA